jgi:hypothetical protein
MPSIFIDANILLGFWSLREGRISDDLLLPLVELSEHVLITQQVADEVNRNKLQVFLANSEFKAGPDAVRYPDHLIEGKEIHELNRVVKELSSSAADATKRWRKIRADTANKISTNTDLTSTMLKPLFANAVRPTTEQFAAARDRYERGNPPGKKSDRLGDQLSWQQFLDAAEGEKRVWIITRDSDYAELVDKRRLLNPFLHRELLEKGVQTVDVHDNLASAIKALKEAGLSASKLDEEKLTELEKEEAKAHHPYSVWGDRPWKCPACSHMNATSHLSAHPSGYGGWSYWIACVHCGTRIDTGEPYDD